MWRLIAGAIFGIIGGMGMGGGVILIPILTWFLGATQQEAQGMNLLCFLPMSVWKKGEFSWVTKRKSGCRCG